MTFLPSVLQISEYQDVIAAAPIVCVDGNFSPAVIERVCQLCSEADVPGMGNSSVALFARDQK